MTTYLPSAIVCRGARSAPIREAAVRFIDEVRGDEADLAGSLRIKERELEAGGLN
jgi:hypothetical protein